MGGVSMSIFLTDEELCNMASEVFRACTYPAILTGIDPAGSITKGN
jgi:hypothetical protein